MKKCLLGPFHETREVPLGLDVLANAEVSRSLFEERVDDTLRLQLLDGERGRGHLLTDLPALERDQIVNIIFKPQRLALFKIFR
jgi:hypothetical protein